MADVEAGRGMTRKLGQAGGCSHWYFLILRGGGGAGERDGVQVVRFGYWQIANRGVGEKENLTQRRGGCWGGVGRVGCPGPSTTRPDVPNGGAKEKPGRCGREDRTERPREEGGVLFACAQSKKPPLHTRRGYCCLEAESRKAATFDLSLARSSSRRYIMWPAS